MEGDTVNKIKASQGAVQALLARVYLYMGNNTKALEYANKVINSGSIHCCQNRIYLNILSLFLKVIVRRFCVPF